MSSYDGTATLESWLEHEIFGFLPEKVVVNMFEPWRESIEVSIEHWLDTDYGEGSYSWRGWGRAYPDDEQFSIVLGQAKKVIAELGVEPSKKKVMSLLSAP